MFKPQEGDEAFAAERQIEARGERAVAVDAEADAVGDFEIAKGQVAPVGGDLAGVDEQRAVEQPRRLPPVYGAHRQSVAILEPELAEASQLMRPAQRPLVKERHVCARPLY